METKKHKIGKTILNQNYCKFRPDSNRLRSSASAEETGRLTMNEWTCIFILVLSVWMKMNLPYQKWLVKLKLPTV